MRRCSSSFTVLVGASFVVCVSLSVLISVVAVAVAVGIVVVVVVSSLGGAVLVEVEAEAKKYWSGSAPLLLLSRSNDGVGCRRW